MTADAEWVDDHWSLMLHTPAGFHAVQLRIAGLHNVKNALAVTACALAAGAPLDAVVRGLEAFEPVKGRSQLKTAVLHGQPVTVVDDTYNANPDSARAAVDVLAQMSGPRWLVLGDMGEVGDQGPAFHEEVGAYAKAQGVDHFWTVGDSSAATTCSIFMKRDPLTTTARAAGACGRAATRSATLSKCRLPAYAPAAWRHSSPTVQK